MGEGCGVGFGDVEGLGEGVGVVVVFGCLEDCPDVVAVFGFGVFVGFVDDYAGFSVSFEGVGDGDVVVLFGGVPDGDGVVVFYCVVCGFNSVASGTNVYGFEVCQVVVGELSVGAGEGDGFGCVEACVA